MKKYVVIVAGGSGARMGGALPKQFLLVHGRPVLWYTLNTFLSAYADLSVILVVPGDYRPAGLDVVASTGAPERIRMADGGVTRFHSVRNGLELIGEESIVFVHDGVRCLLTTTLVHRCYEGALQYGSAIPVVESRDSVRFLTEKGSEAVERRRVKLVQTPQTFRSDVLLNAYQREYSLQFTDEATVVEASGHAVHLVEGEPDNIKLTYPMDLLLAERLLKGRE
jgi:2-C-methyl-D-erythritol 4-phosphate cytidylyltransferase